MMRTRLAQLIAKEEGFGIPGAIPTVRHNPGDLRHGPHEQHPGAPNAVGTVDTDADGWADLERQIQLDVARGLTLREFVYKFAPPTENNSAQYLNFVCGGLGMDADTPLATAAAVPGI
jgi:hypothetical protein